MNAQIKWSANQCTYLVIVENAGDDMSRWMKRSDEEKKRILKDQRNRDNPKDKFDPDHYAALLKGGEIPLNCPDHGYMASHHYTITDGSMSNNPLLTKGTMVISGKCVACNCDTSIVIPTLDPNAILIGMVIQGLAKRNRITDKRVNK